MINFSIIGMNKARVRKDKNSGNLVSSYLGNFSYQQLSWNSRATSDKKHHETLLKCATMPASVFKVDR